MYSFRGIEQYVSELMISNDILKPDDLTIEKLSEMLDADVAFGNITSSYTVNDMRFIIIDKNAPNEIEAYCQFLHELAHFVFDDPMLITKNYRTFKYYEVRKNNIVQHLAVPKHMLSYVDLKSSDLCRDLMDTFHITYDLAYKRYESLKAKIVASSNY